MGVVRGDRPAPAGDRARRDRARGARGHGLRQGRIALALAVIVAGVACCALIVQALDLPDLATAGTRPPPRRAAASAPSSPCSPGSGSRGAWRSIEDQAMPEEPEPEPEPELELNPEPEPRAGLPVRSAGVAEFEALVGRSPAPARGAGRWPRRVPTTAASRPSPACSRATTSPCTWARPRPAPPPGGAVPPVVRPHEGHVSLRDRERAAAREGVDVDGAARPPRDERRLRPVLHPRQGGGGGPPVRYLEVESRGCGPFEVYGPLALGTTEFATDAA